MNKIEYFDEPLARHTTFRIGGPAERLIIPPDQKMLLDILRSYTGYRTPYFILGRGSNTLIRDDGINGIVIKNTKACDKLDISANNVRTGSSVTLQRLVNFCIENNLYGMEFLYSIPGNVGGAIYMNAGRGKKFNQFISNHVVSVEIFDGQYVRKINREQCLFGYRSSIFQGNNKWFILSVILNLPKQDKEIGIQKINERMELVRKTQDSSYPNAGTVFKNYFNPLPEIIGYRIGKAQFSTKTPGWIINLGGATFEDVYGLIKYAIKVHKRHGLITPELELVIMPKSKRAGILSRYFKVFFT